MTCTEEYKEHIEYTFHAFCKIVIRNASYTAIRTWSRKHKREISLNYLTDEKHYPFGMTDEYFKAPEHYGEYLITICGDTVVLYDELLAAALSRLPVLEREMVFYYFFITHQQKNMGYFKVITYILESENGASLKSSNFICKGKAGGKHWTGSRNTGIAIPNEMKTRWEMNL